MEPFWMKMRRKKWMLLIKWESSFYSSKTDRTWPTSAVRAEIFKRSPGWLAGWFRPVLKAGGIGIVIRAIKAPCHPSKNRHITSINHPNSSRMSPPSLPQEIIHQILSNIPTKLLCALLPTSKSIFLDVTAILHARLETHLLSKGDHKLIVLPSSSLKLTSSSKRSSHQINVMCHTTCQVTPTPSRNPHPSRLRCTVTFPSLPGQKIRVPGPVDFNSRLHWKRYTHSVSPLMIPGHNLRYRAI